jgi:hypothetical protein
VGTEVLAPFPAGAAVASGKGWRLDDDGTLTVRIADPLAAVTIGVE